jgi:hypothetical protein
MQSLSPHAKSASAGGLPTRPRQTHALMIAIALAIVSCVAGSPALASSTTAAIKKIARIYAQDSIQTGGSISGNSPAHLRAITPAFTVACSSTRKPPSLWLLSRERWARAPL